jgi:hypothetical protein
VYSSLYNTVEVGPAAYQPITEDLELIEALTKRKRNGVEPTHLSERLNGESEPGKREDWMMEPGTGKSMEEILGLGGEGFGKTRKFMDSKSARKSAQQSTQDGETREPTAAELKNQEVSYELFKDI